MALVVKDRVRETSTTTGTGTLTLAGAVSGFQTFSSAIGNTNTTYYTIIGGTEWETGLGTVAAGTLARTTVLESSNAGSAVNFSAGTKDVFGTYPASKALYKDASGNAIGLGTVAATTTLTSAVGLPLSTGVTGTLPIANGGTNSTATATAGGAGYGTGTAHAYTAAGTTGQALISAGASAPSFGTLGVAGGGTGAATLTANNVLLGNGTSAVTFVAPSTSGNLLTSNGTVWTSTAPAASGPTVKYVTDTTDITLVNIASSQVNVGSSFSVSIPTTGYINLTAYAGRLTWSSVADYVSIVWGIRISSTNYWFGKWNNNGTIAYGGIVSFNCAAGFDEFYGSVVKWTNISILQSGAAALGLDITANSVPTGTQTVQLIAAYGAFGLTGIGILKGTTTTTRVGLQFSSGS